MSLDCLIHALAPPSEPDRIPDEHELRSLELQIGTRLPSDYLDFLRLYGPGSIDHFLWVLMADQKEPNISLLDYLRDYESTLAVQPNAIPGMIPFAVTDNGDRLFWRTDGEPEDWPVIVEPARDEIRYEYPLSFCAFLSRLMRHELRCPAFPDDFPSANPGFAALSTIAPNESAKSNST